MNNVHQIIYHFWNSAILRAGIKLGLFSLLDKKQPCSCQFIADSLNADFHFVQSFLESCVALSLLEKKQTRKPYMSD